MLKALLVGGPAAMCSSLYQALHAVDAHASLTTASTVMGARDALAGGAGFDLVVIDLSVADADATVLLVDLHSVAPARPIVALLSADRRSDVLCAVELGAVGVLHREADGRVVAQAVRGVLAGGVHVPSHLLRPAATARMSMASAIDALPFGDAAPSFGGPVPTTAVLATLGLTRRQTDVLALLLRGQRNKSIARALNLSVETVKDHVAAVLRTLHVTSRIEAVLAVGRLLQERDRAAASPPLPTLQSAWTRSHAAAELR